MKDASDKVENSVVVGFSPKLEARVKQLEDRVYELDCLLLKQQKQIEQVGQSCLTLAETLREVLMMMSRAGF